MRTEQIHSPSEAEHRQSKSDTSPIHLAGYELTTLLGSGGYGEVWKAIGPGGFPKAVKILFGQRDGDQAGAELKSLNRMRQLRHPFLLNIERVEVCDNRLIVVTELADRNLTQHFDACVRNGHRGIPRDELLAYLGEAADALDFMSEEHGLQHLDIKPDNLLLQGRHIKLGDFGLAKDISIANVSLINGFTPLYAAPEVFEGRPGRFSDQYSLAIVYQSMLTGNPPFNGRNAAQLTAQHLRSQPDLSPLAPPDRPVIARALSKTASARFPCCREFVSELKDRTRRAHASGFSTPSENAASAAAAPVNREPECSPMPADAESSKPFRPAATEIERNILHPTLVIGVGGLAGEVLRQVKGQWNGLSKNRVPAWQVLAVDTDSQSLRSIKGLNSGQQLTDVEALPIALRSSQGYRDARNMDMSWLSRRWLFNIPRSGQVENMRPLARLAVQDHLEALKGRIRDRLSATIEADAVLQSAAAVGAPFADKQVDVVVVAGISGGTGSGAVVDVGLIVRQVAAEFPGINVVVNSVLLHSTSRQQRVDGIQVANTMACLKELRLQSIDGMGIPKGFTREAAEFRPFDRTWLFHGGDRLSDSEYSQFKVGVARFLVNTTASAAATCWREGNAATETTPDEPVLRLAGMATVDSEVYSLAEAEAASLAGAVVNRWLDTSSEQGNSDKLSVECTRELLTSLNLTATTFPGKVLQELRGESGQRIEEVVADVLGQLKEAAGRATCVKVASMAFENNESGASLHLKQMEDQLRRRLNREGEASQSKIRSLLFDLMEAGGAGQIQIAVEVGQSELTAAQDRCRELSREIDLAFQALTSGPDGSGPASPGSDVAQEFCRQYAVLTGSRVIYQVFEDAVGQMLESLGQVAESTRSVLETIVQTRQLLSETYELHEGIPAPVVGAFQSHLSGDEEMRLRNVARRGGDLRTFASRLLDCATGFLLAAGGKESSQDATFPAAAWPGIQGVGGDHRIIAWVNQGGDLERWRSRLIGEFGDCVAVFPTSSSVVSALCETQNVETARLLKFLQTENPSAWELAGRVHTRVDVQW